VNAGANDTSAIYYAVLWRKPTARKNKTWDGDGILCVRDGQAFLKDDKGKDLGRTSCKGPLLVGSGISVGGREVEVESMMSRDEYQSGQKNLQKATKAPSSLKQIDGTNAVSQKAQARHNKIAANQKERSTAEVSSTQASRSSFKNPLAVNHVQDMPKDVAVAIPRHDPKAPNSLIMKRPRRIPKGRQVVDVVVDPLLTRALREHQRAGISFMYECVMGMKSHGGEGAVLADEMGLGKTLQTIALIWTLLKQNPIYNDPPVIKKALIVCPVTLIQNWRNEFRKWLGNERVGIYVADNNKQRITDFTRGKAYSVMIVGYEKLVKVKADLLKCDDIGIVIADEGHRLKTQSNKAAAAIKELRTERRVILSGTPIQNDLAEFFTMANFVNPGVLNTLAHFKKEFEVPILRSRQPGASADDLEKGESRNQELAELTSSFILRRTAEILSKYLPTKTEYVLFCRPTKSQASIYRKIVSTPAFGTGFGAPHNQLQLINVLKKICNSPSLLLEKDADEQEKESTVKDAIKGVPQRVLRENVTSGKLRVLDALLHQIHENTEEKVVLVSNYTSTLDILERMIGALGYTHLRLDGSTPTSKRQDLVNRFNRSTKSNSFIFLLSAKAGGVGLNLIGASRLILFDIDWNPATDLQAMARVHRDGQKHPCFIYRLLTQGALDEKIFQRQVSKTGLADSVVDGKSAVSGFTQEELRDLFSLDESPDCGTHKLLDCPCGGNGLPVRGSADDAELSYDEETGAEVVRMDEDEDEDSTLSSMPTSLAKVDREAQEEEIRREARECKDSMGRRKMLSLMQYTHLDTSLYAQSAAQAPPNDAEVEDDDCPDPIAGQIDDGVLRDVVLADACSVGFVFSKMSAS
jgi:DNA repair and recombination protein RAD54B